MDGGVAREQARKDLPLPTYTIAYWKMDLHNLLHFLRLRMDSHAQKEIREYANAIAGFVEKWVPHTWQAFRDYRLNSMSLTDSEIQLIVACNMLGLTVAKDRISTLGWDKKSNREAKEAKDKFARLGLTELVGLLDG